MPLLYGEKKLRVAPSGGIGIIAEARRGATSIHTTVQLCLKTEKLKIASES